VHSGRGILAQKENRGVFDSIRYAKDWRIRPLSLVSFSQPDDSWEPLDFLLIKAYEYLMDNFTCPKCGGWIWECSSDVDAAKGLTHEIHDVICYKTQAREQHEHSLRPDSSKVKEHERKSWGRYSTILSHMPEEHSEMYHEPTISDYLTSHQKASE
jgi:hypothetical protein